MDESWVVLTEHLMPASWIPIDEGSEELLFVEAALKQEGIEVAFDPFRPGEGGGLAFDMAQPIRLMVPKEQLERAQKILDEVRASEPGSVE